MTATANTIGGAATTTTAPLPVAINIDPVQDLLAIYTNSAAATQAISRNTLLGITSQPLGLTDSQSPQNKTFDNTNVLMIKDANLTIQDDGDVTKQAKFQLSGLTTATTRTYTLPDITDTLTTNTAPQTLTNKTLTSPVISGGSIDNAAITVDSISGHTTSNTGTIYGVPVSLGLINGANLALASVTNTQIATNGVSGANLATNAITLGYAQITSNPANVSSTTVVQVSGLSVSVTIPAGGRKVEITAFVPYIQGGSSQTAAISIWDGTVGTGTKISEADNSLGTGTFASFYASAIVTPSAGSKTYNVGAAVTTNAATINASAVNPAYILVKVI